MKNEITGMKLRLIVMNFLQFAVWGAYLTSMGTYLFNIGLGARIGLFYAMQGIVSSIYYTHLTLTTSYSV